MVTADHLNVSVQPGEDRSLSVQLHQPDVEEQTGEDAEEVGKAVGEKVIDDLLQLKQTLMALPN